VIDSVSVNVCLNEYVLEEREKETERNKERENVCVCVCVCVGKIEVHKKYVCQA
jgi:hypothetical protein